MTYQEYEKQVVEQLDRWIDAVIGNGSLRRQMKERAEAENRVASWCEAFPTQRGLIQRFVVTHISLRL